MTTHLAFPTMSMCPHEGNTDKRELPRIEVSMSAQPPGRTVVPPSAYEVGLSLINNAEEEMTYQLTRVHSKDGEGAIVVINGDSLEEPRLYTLQKDYVLNEVVFIYKGTNKAPANGAATYDVTLALSSTCDSEIFAQQTIKATFLQECPKIQWFGIVEHDQTFVVNNVQEKKNTVDLQLRNAEAPSRMWKTDARLQSIFIEYRVMGTADWKSAKEKVDSKLQDINAKPREDDFGFATVSWDTSSITIDGVYEIRAKTWCGPNMIGSLPATVSYQETTHIVGVIDRKSPMLFKDPEPADLLFSAGDEISISFSEDIDCAAAALTLDVREPTGEIIASMDFSTSHLIVRCTKSKIDVWSQMLVKYVGKVGQVKVAGIRDLAGNPASGPVSWWFTFATRADPTTQYTVKDLLLTYTWPKSMSAVASDSAQWTAFAQNVKVALSTLTGASPTRFQILSCKAGLPENALPNGDNPQTFVTFNVLPVVNGIRRRSIEDDGDGSKDELMEELSALELTQLLMTMVRKDSKYPLSENGMVGGVGEVPEFSILKRLGSLSDSIVVLDLVILAALLWGARRLNIANARLKAGMEKMMHLLERRK